MTRVRRSSILGRMAAAPPHIHTGSDGRFRVWDGDRFAAIYEPDDYASAQAHLQRLEPKRRKRPVAETPRELVLSTEVRAVRRGSTDVAAEDPERVHVKEFSDGWRVWNPLSRSYVGAADRGAFSAKTDAMFRARELTLQAGASRSPAARAPARRSADVEGGGLFSAREVAAPGQQVGFKFNGRPVPVPVPLAMFADNDLAAAVARSASGSGYDATFRDVLADGRADVHTIHFSDRDRAFERARGYVFGNGHRKANGVEKKPALVMAERQTADGSRLRLWSDGALTGGGGYGFPGVPIARPRDAAKAELLRTAGWLVLGEAELYHDAEIPKLYAAALRVAASGGDPGDLRASAAKSLDTLHIPIRWEVLTADRNGHPTTRFGHLPRLGWAGVGVWHEGNVYEVMHQHHGPAVGAQSRDAWHGTGFKFTSQRELFKHLAANRPVITSARPAKPNHRLQGRRGMQPEVMPHYADVAPIGRATTRDDAPPRRRSVDQYDALSVPRPNGVRKARKRRRAGR